MFLLGGSLPFFGCGESSKATNAPLVTPGPPGEVPTVPPAPTTSPAGDGGAEAAVDAAPPEPPWVWVPPVVPASSPGCGVDATSGDSLDYAVPGGRTYHVWGPTNYDKDKKYSVVVALHGWQATGKAHQSWFEMEKYVDRSETFVVYPDAVNGLWDLGTDADLVFYDAMMQDLGARFCVDPSRVLAFGFSWGGKFANHLGCKRAGWVKAVAVGAGSYGGDYQKCGRLPVLFTHRTADTDERIEWARQAAGYWQNIDVCQKTTEVSDPAMNCVSNVGCQPPGSLTFCEDTSVEPTWPAQWNHTVRENYRAHVYTWFKNLP